METLDIRLQKRMHVSLYALLFLTVLLGISVLLEGCTDTCETKVQYTYFEPVYTSHEELRAATTIIDPQPMQVIGRIYTKDDYLYINSPGKGIHIIDNANPADPQQKSFLNIPGNFDLAIMGNTLYADSYTDLVMFDVSNVNNIHEVNRLASVFYNYNHPSEFQFDPVRGILTGWTQKERMEVAQSDCSSNIVQPYFYLSEGIAVRDAAAFSSAANKSLATTPGNGSGPGVGGSMARFTINGDYLYALDGGYVQPFDISSSSQPVAKAEYLVGWDIETIFPYNSNLFIGSSTGMHILDVSEPATPQLLSTYQHIRSCDPVVVQDQYAYVTLRSGTECMGFTNQLEVIDISNLSSPALVKTYQMTNPWGLGIDGSTLFVCDGSAGLKVFDASDVHAISDNQLAHYQNINAMDVIPFNNVVMMIGADGLYQYDYSNPADIKFLSHLPVNQ